MASSSWSETVLQLIRRMNNFYLPGSCRANCSRFEVDGVQVGWIRPHVASLLKPHGDVFTPAPHGAVSLSPSLDSYDRRGDAVNAVIEGLRGENSLTCLQGWRDEKYNVMAKFSDPPVMWMERAATSLFGVRRYGVHVNGYTVSESGETSMWLGRRSQTKQTYPGLLDNMAAGGLAAGMSIRHTLIKECEEEACVPAALAENARPVSTVSYTYEDGEGVFAESQFVFDLKLPPDFKPRVGDGEVQDFYLVPIDKAKELIASSDFKPNCAMMVLDFLIRHSFVDPDKESFYQEFVSGLHQTF